ncbi:DUF3871 family protein [Lacinutrix sp. C3R15]|uniref:DUF3871 family protein n=1 Tax=Flavobacteriaceae TaxID=49546 RepID=UPI001C083FBA|nr:MULTISPECIES: DUF3871 family protein [Flavobacteriaceae]MBU2939854.1 DUF3871 family protein [Lacinutrix sp. C3R15]MDO6623170.1 DUF3871 family protein [Oceanihabitans sp. 1_MG-2023]
MEIVSVTELNKQRNGVINIPEGKPEVVHNLQIPSENKVYQQNPFIEANTKEVSLSTLKHDCIIPVFSKDNEKTLAHQEFIEIAQDCVGKVFSHHTIEVPEVRVSHQIKGRTADAIYKPVKELLEHEKTQYFERMAFIIRIPSITESINGHDVSLTVGGVRAYNQENLYNRKTYEKFKFFIGFQNMVCCNLCISTDGYQDEMRVGNYSELQSKIMDLIENYNAQSHLQEMKQLSQHNLTEQQFAQLIGRARLYNFLPKEEKTLIPELMLNDGQISTVAKDYYLDNSFCRNENGDINLWNVYNLFTGANKSSYIDSFLSRNVNAFDFTQGLANAINGDSKHRWFLS